MKAFIEYFDSKKQAEEMEIKGIHSGKEGIRFILDDDDLPFPNDVFISYKDLQKITIYDLQSK